MVVVGTRKMKVDDENSIYVGGLPYECTESQLRRVFELYGSVIAVKIINDRAVGGKCYGFVTFTNPRSAVEAISEMDGRTIGGRVVRVNEVKMRGAGGRSNHGRDNFRRSERDMDWDRDRGRQSDHDRDRYRDHSREVDGKRERGHDHSHDHDVDHATDRFQVRDRAQSREMEDRGRGHSRNHGWEWERERDDDFVASPDRQLDKIDGDDRRGDNNIDRHTLRKNSSSSYEQQSREHSSESGDYYHQVEEQLHLLTQRREELQKEKSDMEQKLEEKKQLIVNLQKRSMKLEDGLISAKKLTSKRQMQLTKLRKCFQQVKECAERLKGSEQELQDLVNSVSMEIDTDGALGARGLYLANGKE